MLEQKLLAIAQTLGKVDEYGQVTEDLRGQVLGQLAERISYDQLYQDAVRDPTLRRTKEELEVAMENAKLARNVVFQLFQDLDSFNLDDYRKFDDGGAGMNRLLAFTRDCAEAAGATIRQAREGVYEISLPNDGSHAFTTNREMAKNNDDLGLLGLEHPVVRKMLTDSHNLAASERAIMARSERLAGKPCILSVWRIEIQGASSYYRQAIVPLAINSAGHRLPTGETLLHSLRDTQPALEGVLDRTKRNELITSVLPEMLRREVEHRGLLREGSSLAMKLIGWMEFS
jgi:hypothetical protein